MMLLCYRNAPGLLQEGRPLVATVPELSEEQAKLAKQAKAEMGQDLLKDACLNERTM